MGIDMLNQAVSVLAHPEEISFFLCLRDRAAAVGTLAVDKLAFCPEGFAGCAVPAFVGTLVNISLIVKLLEDLLNLLLVRRIRGADETVIAGAHQIPDLTDHAGIPVDKFLRRHAGFRSLDLILLTMFIRPGLKNDIITFSPFIAGDRIRQHSLIGIADMRLAGRVGNRGCDIVRFLFCHSCTVPFLCE